MEDLQLLKQQNLGLQVQQLFAEQGPLCDSEGFYQHQGECWNDALQMIFLYSDGFKELVQKKLASAPVDPSEVDDLFRPEAEALLEKLEKEDKRILANNADRIQFGLLYTSLIYEYLNSLQKRFYRHYLAETMRLTRLRQDELCSLEDLKGLKALKQLREISFATRAKGKEGVLAAFFGQQLKLKNINQRRNPKKLEDLYVPGGSRDTETHVINIFQRYFGLPGTLNEIRTTYKTGEARYKDTTTMELFNVTSKTIGIFCGIGKGEDAHAVAFLACGSREYYYDDNHGSTLFPWRKFLGLVQEKKSEKIRQAEIAWAKKSKQKLTESDGYMDREIFFNGALKIKDAEGNALFEINTYPYYFRRAWEYNPTKLYAEYSTFLWNGEQIKMYPSSKNAATITKTFKLQDGNELTYTLTFEKPKDILAIAFQFEATEEIQRKNLLNTQFKQSGTVLGTRLNVENDRISEIAIEQQLEKVKAGKAMIDDVFYIKTFRYTPLLMAIQIKNSPLIKKILKMGADPNKKIENRSPLYYAVSSFDIDEPEILQLLLDSGADINDSNNGISGFTALMGCIITNEGDEMIDAVKFLLKKGADVHIRTKRYEATAIELALFVKRFPPIIDALVAYGAVLPQCPTKEDLLKRVGLDSPIMNLIRQEKLIHAGILAKCYREHELYDALDYENMVGDTALKLVIAYPSTSFIDDLIDSLVYNGADVNYVDRYGNTPLHYAIELQRPAVVQKLLDHGAKPNVIVKGYGTAMQHAQRIGNQGIIDAIKEVMDKPRFGKVEYATRKVKKQLPKPPKQNLRFKHRVTLKAATKAEMKKNTNL